MNELEKLRKKQEELLKMQAIHAQNILALSSDVSGDAEAAQEVFAKLHNYVSAKKIVDRELTEVSLSISLMNRLTPKANKPRAIGVISRRR